MNQDAKFCDQCGHELPSEIAPVSLPIAVTILRAIAILYAAVAGFSVLDRPAEVETLAIMRDAFGVFFIWVHADVIRVVLQIRDRV